MHILIFIFGMIVGVILNYLIESIAYSIDKSRRKAINFLIPVICAFSFEILFLRLGVTVLLAKALAITAILIIISFIDLRYRIIPDFIVVLTLVIGVIFSVATRNNITDTVLGMLCGGGVLFLISLLPNAMGGGDIKFMFAAGAFLGLQRTVWALLLAFIFSSIFSIVLILAKIIGTKDYIPFGPFLAVGSYISLLIFI
jgi:leader peptidase (prepilin peptidase)/N-methyltransferase